MKFPIILIKKGEAPLYFFNESDFGLVSKGGDTFYKSGIVYDSDGGRFLINGIRSIQRAPFLKSIKYFQPMYKVDVKYDNPSGNIDLPDFKQIMIDHIKSHKKYWMSKDTFESLKSSILDKSSFSDIIIFLR